MRPRGYTLTELVAGVTLSLAACAGGLVAVNTGARRQLSAHGLEVARTAVMRADRVVAGGGDACAVLRAVGVEGSGDCNRMQAHGVLNGPPRVGVHAVVEDATEAPGQVRVALRFVLPGAGGPREVAHAWLLPR